VRRAPESGAPDEVRLPGVLDEFRRALRAEIEAARRSAASRAVQLRNGRMIAQIGEGTQYVFQIESALSLPADSPCDLRVPGYGTTQATVICVEGLAITLSVPGDLGRFVPEARLQTDLAFLMERLVARIEALAGAANSVGERVRGVIPVSGTPASFTTGKLAVDDQQRTAVESALGRNTTFIWGPPGTGKTYTIGAICEQLYRQGRATLLVSHTNIAVDQAMLHVAKALGPDELRKGMVVRVGDPHDKRLVDSYPDVLMKTQVQRRAAELAGRRDALVAERNTVAEEAKRLSRNVDVCEWVAEAEQDILDVGAELERVQELEAEIERARTRAAELGRAAESWRQAAEAARTAAKQEAEIADMDERLAGARRRFVELEAKATQAARALANAEEILGRAQEVAPLRAEARRLPSLGCQERHAAQVRTDAAAASKKLEGVFSELSHAKAVYLETTSVGRLRRLWRGLPDPEAQKALVERLEAETAVATQGRDAAAAALDEVERLLLRCTKLSEQLRQAAHIPDVEVQKSVADCRRSELQSVQEELADLTSSVQELGQIRSGLSAGIAAFERRHSATPGEVLAEAEPQETKWAAAKSAADGVVRDWAGRRQALGGVLRSRLSVLQQWGLAPAHPESLAEMFSAIHDGHERAAREVAGLSLPQLRAQLDAANGHVQALGGSIRELDEALLRVEELVISEAVLLATTLTRTYLRDDIQARRFDTVILDEASMAPVPALWVAASLADANAVVVGDWKQLPPIVISEDEVAQKWLGRDIFAVARVSDDYGHPPHRVDLTQQRRMHPEISAIPNELVYGGRLRDDKSTFSEASDDALASWYRHDWGHDSPVLLIDTEPAQAWVTAVPGGRGSSRLNFFSATVCVDIAVQLLRQGRPTWKHGERRRMLVVCPYRAHARLLSLLLKEERIADDVMAGTIHSFQGSETEVVVLDLVNDEPHRRVRMFDPKRDDSIRRLLNVALTRARRRLIIVGDFGYIGKMARKAFIGAELVPFLRRRYPSVSALDVVPSGLAARAAKAQAAVLGGRAEPAGERSVVTHEGFFPLLRGDLAEAKSRVVVFSAFITQRRLGDLASEVRACIDRGVRLYVVTMAHEDRRKRELGEYRRLEAALAEWGAIVVHKRNMHEKLIFIDDQILWEGSLNALSQSHTQEVMQRYRSESVFREFWRIAHVQELLDEYDRGTPRCPRCGCEVVASEGGRTPKSQPFYWCCVQNDCYERYIDEPRCEDGIVRCRKCGASVEYDLWGGRPAWRCTANRRHHQTVARTHLMLPKMRTVVPSQELRRLDKEYGIRSEGVQLLDKQGQAKLFDVPPG